MSWAVPLDGRLPFLDWIGPSLLDWQYLPDRVVLLQRECFRWQGWRFLWTVINIEVELEFSIPTVQLLILMYKISFMSAGLISASGSTRLGALQVYGYGFNDLQLLVS